MDHAADFRFDVRSMDLVWRSADAESGRRALSYPINGLCRLAPRENFQPTY